MPLYQYHYHHISVFTTHFYYYSPMMGVKRNNVNHLDKCVCVFMWLVMCTCIKSQWLTKGKAWERGTALETNAWQGKVMWWWNVFQIHQPLPRGSPPHPSSCAQPENQGDNGLALCSTQIMETSTSTMNINTPTPHGISQPPQITQLDLCIPPVFIETFQTV